MTVCNPWSLLNFFSKPELCFCSYWLDTGGTDHSVLVQCLQRMERLQNQDGGQGNLADFSVDNYSVRRSSRKFQSFISSIANRDLPLVSVLFQAGYFTIKGIENGRFVLGIPNAEVQTVFMDAVLEAEP